MRHTLLEIGLARLSAEGQHDKTALVYDYLTGPRLRQRVGAIVEAFSTMQWAKREAQIERVKNTTVGIYGDSQGIAGKSLQEIEGLEMRALGVDELD